MSITCGLPDLGLHDYYRTIQERRNAKPELEPSSTLGELHDNLMDWIDDLVEWHMGNFLPLAFRDFKIHMGGVVWNTPADMAEITIRNDWEHLHMPILERYTRPIMATSTLEIRFKVYKPIRATINSRTAIIDFEGHSKEFNMVSERQPWHEGGGFHLVATCRVYDCDYANDEFIKMIALLLAS